MGLGLSCNDSNEILEELRAQRKMLTALMAKADAAELLLAHLQESILIIGTSFEFPRVDTPMQAGSGFIVQSESDGEMQQLLILTAHQLYVEEDRDEENNPIMGGAKYLVVTLPDRSSSYPIDLTNHGTRDQLRSRLTDAGVNDLVALPLAAVTDAARSPVDQQFSLADFVAKNKIASLTLASRSPNMGATAACGSAHEGTFLSTCIVGKEKLQDPVERSSSGSPVVVLVDSQPVVCGVVDYSPYATDNSMYRTHFSSSFPSGQDRLNWDNVPATVRGDNKMQMLRAEELLAKDLFASMP
mmetsp:Transcript_29031/g.52883  ORF Transcript_29031/g.52883 Transcript_29031/m.52883 type:complete len:300 (-) Transcript_29031:105-1004(-)